MIEPKVSEFLDGIKQALSDMEAALRNVKGHGFTFDGMANSYQAVYGLFDRKDMIEKLRALSQKSSIVAEEWVNIKTQINYLSSLERDVRMRYRSRLDCYRVGALNKRFMALNFELFRNETGK